MIIDKWFDIDVKGRQFFHLFSDPILF